jgi:putative membrane protein
MTFEKKGNCIMRLLLTAAAASLAIATAACQKAAETPDPAANDLAMTEESMANDINMAGMAATPMAATDFASTVAASDMFEIATGRLAQANATNAELKSFGSMLVTDHAKSTADLKTAAAAATPPVALPAAMPAELQAKVDALVAAKGAEFDRLFLEQQKDGHQKALDALKSYAASGDAPALRSFAEKAVPVVQAHLDKLEGMKL